MPDHLVWNVDPVLFRAGPLAIRYYGIFFGIAIVTGFVIWYRRTSRFGEPPAVSESMLLYGVPAVIIGGRLGECLFYQPITYLRNPLRVFAIWEGGLASHGVAVGLAIAIALLARKHRLTWWKIADYFAPAVALAVGWVRIGNFFNSEIVGHPSNVPWAIVFARYDALPRHPAQLYDFLIGPATYLVLRAIERRNIRPIGSGLIAGSFLTVYFGLRMFVEPFKAFFLEQMRELTPFREIEAWLGVSIHTGQWLSIPPVLIGIVIIVRALRMHRASDASSPAILHTTAA